MATTITCDKCLRPVATVGYRVSLIAVTLPEFGEVNVAGEFCSTTCLSQHLAALRVKVPNFAAAHAELDRVFAADALDDAIDSGALDSPEEPETFEGELSEPTRHLMFDHLRRINRRTA